MVKRNNDFFAVSPEGKPYVFPKSVISREGRINFLEKIDKNSCLPGSKWRYLPGKPRDYKKILKW